MKPLNLFVLLAYGLFIAGFAITGILITVGAPANLVVFAQIAMAWTPTIAFAIIHNRVDPGRSLWRYIADRFARRIRLLPLLASILIPVFATMLVWIGYSMTTGEALLDLFVPVSAVSFLLMFLDSLVRGPLGEELGWRGYLQLELNKRFSLVKSSLIVGVIWGFWHTPLWFVSGYQGVALLLYILFFLVGLIAFSVIIGYIFNRGGNLLYAILLHQMINFSGMLLDIDTLIVLGGSSLVYVITALVMWLVAIRSSPEGVAAQ